MTEKLRHYPKIKGLVPRNTRDVDVWGQKSLRPMALDFLEEFRPGLPERPSLVSSSVGALDDVLLTIPAYAVQEDAIGTVYRDLIGKLPAQVRFIVLTHSATEAAVRGWFSEIGAEQRATIVVAPDHLHFSIWAEDGYVVVHDQASNERFFVEPFEFPRYADGLIADMVAHATPMQSTQAPLYFQGGNVLIGDDFFLIGADYPANSLKYVNRVVIPNPGEKPSETVHRLYRSHLDPQRDLIYVGSTLPVPHQVERKLEHNGEQWKEILYFGNKEGTVQPLFHIDMFITLAGRDAADKRQVVVGDPRLAAEVLGQSVWPHAMVEVFDNIARGLERRGFRVIRNPLPLAYMDDPQNKERVWYFATSNNALVQIANGTKRIWIPTYGHGAWGALRATDDANRAVWESLGFDVTPLGDFHPFAENLGAVHCIKKYLSRS